MTRQLSNPFLGQPSSAISLPPRCLAAQMKLCPISHLSITHKSREQGPLPSLSDFRLSSSVAQEIEAKGCCFFIFSDTETAMAPLPLSLSPSSVTVIHYPFSSSPAVTR